VGALLIIALLPSAVALSFSGRRARQPLRAVEDGSTVEAKAEATREAARSSSLEASAMARKEEGQAEVDAEAGAERRRARMLAASKAAAAAYESERRRKVLVALGSATMGATAFGWQRTVGAATDPLALLHTMEAESPPIGLALLSGKPTVVDFYADWCENCRAMAPRLAALEKEYGGRVNFVTLNAEAPDGRNDALVQLFKVDGIPHLAFVDSEPDVRTALIGMVPKEVLRADVEALLSAANQATGSPEAAIPKAELPYVGFDAFREDHAALGKALRAAVEAARRRQAEEQGGA